MLAIANVPAFCCGMNFLLTREWERPAVTRVSSRIAQDRY